mgnify:CR=1 FL=1
MTGATIMSKHINLFGYSLWIADEILQESEDKLSILSASVLKLKNEMDLLTTVKFIVSEEGVKSFIVKKNYNTKQFFQK